MGRVRKFSKPHRSGWVGSTSFENSRVGSGRVGSSRVGSGRVGSGRVKSGRVNRFTNLAGRVGSRCFENSRVGSGHDPRDTGHVTGRATLTRELYFSDPRVGPVDLTRGSKTLKPYYSYPRASAVLLLLDNNNKLSLKHRQKCIDIYVLMS